MLIAFVSSAFGISSLPWFDVSHSEQEGAWLKVDLLCKQLDQAGGNAAVGHPALCLPTSKSSQYRAESPIFWYFIITVNIATYVSSGTSQMPHFLGFLTVSRCWKAASLKLSIFIFFRASCLILTLITQLLIWGRAMVTFRALGT